MSKIIVLNDEAFDSLIGTLKQAMDDSKCLADWLNAKAHAELIESQKDARRSVFEWHPVSEKPKDASDIVVKYNDGFLCSGVAHADENGNWVCYEYGKNQMKEWAYLPE
jgi:hypothetical protein